MRPGGKQEKAWAKRSYVQLSILQEVQKLVKELTQRLEKLKITVRNRQNPPRHNQSLILKVRGVFIVVVLIFTLDIMHECMLR